MKEHSSIFNIDNSFIIAAGVDDRLKDRDLVNDGFVSARYMEVWEFGVLGLVFCPCSHQNYRPQNPLPPSFHSTIARHRHSKSP